MGTRGLYSFSYLFLFFYSFSLFLTQVVFAVLMSQQQTPYIIQEWELTSLPVGRMRQSDCKSLSRKIYESGLCRCHTSQVQLLYVLLIMGSWELEMRMSFLTHYFSVITLMKGRLTIVSPEEMLIFTGCSSVNILYFWY